MTDVRSRSSSNAMAIGWAIASFTLVVLALAFFTVLALGPSASERAQADAGATEGTLWVALALVAAVGTFLLIKRHGTPQDADWKGFWIGVVIALVGVGISAKSYDATARDGGTYVVAWGAILVGGLMALRGLTRRGGSPARGNYQTRPAATAAVAYVAPTTLQAPRPANKVCPDCAETVQAAARICRFCRYEFPELPTRRIASNRVCPECSQTVRIGEASCRYCNYFLGSG